MTIKIDSEIQSFFCTKCNELVNTSGMVGPFAHMQREWLERKCNIPEPPWPWLLTHLHFLSIQHLYVTLLPNGELVFHHFGASGHSNSELFPILHNF